MFFLLEVQVWITGGVFWMFLVCLFLLGHTWGLASNRSGMMTPQHGDDCCPYTIRFTS